MRCSSFVLVIACGIVACGKSSSREPPKSAPSGASPASDAAAPTPSPGSGSSVAAAWAVPEGWKSEVIPFPLDFAKDLAHEGIEELRFPGGFFDPSSSEYWSYAFIWRTTDPAVLDAAALGDELTRYFRGLVASVDERKQREPKPADQITASAVANGARFELTAHTFDAFGDGRAVDLVGWAERRPCGSGSLWVFVLAPAKSSVRAQLDELAGAATCL